MKNHVARGDMGPLKRVMSRAVIALDTVTPWPSEHTIVDLRWTPNPGRVGILMRSNEPESTETRLGWIGNKARAWAWTGVLGEDLLPLLRGGDHTKPLVADAVDDGIGSFAMVGATPDSLRVFTNVHRSEAMYYTEVDDVVLFSNSAAALNLVRHDSATPVYSPLGLAGAIVHGLPVTSSTVFADVQIAPPGSRIVSDSTHDLRVEDRYVWQADADASFDEVASAIADSLVTYAKTLAGGAEKVIAAITGGKDSRLVVSALTAAGVPFLAYTNGLDESGEVHVGRQVAALIGAEHRTNRPAMTTAPSGKSFVAAQPELQAWMTLRSTGGLGNAFTTLPDPAKAHVLITKSVNLGGQGGEIIRGGWARSLAANDHGRDSALQLIRKSWFNNGDLLSPLAREAMHLDLAGSLARIGDAPVRGMLDAYVRNRTGRWLATMRHGESVVAPHATLLINNRMVRRILAAPDETLIEERLAHRVMNTIVPGIADLPFFRDRWTFEAKGPSTFHDPEGWAGRNPYTATDVPRANFNWRVAYTPALADYFTSYVLDNDSSLLFDVLDRKAVEKMLSGSRYRAPAAWALFSAQYTLNNGWLGGRPESPDTIQIEVPQA
ncbi:hypothetical protein V6K52_19720 [Knoellia sp. S7-12]|uniref:hypothetical protein n=1 Tax=Knoellia sp. S7-12 TaxID=3126698 RepID=UPI003369430A